MIASLRARHWRYWGMAIDSASVGSEPQGSPRRTAFPAILGVELRFYGDSALATVSWDMYDCGTHGGLRGIIDDTNLFTRTTDGWRLSGSRGGGVADVLCPGR
jgi:hypothetical protein